MSQEQMIENVAPVIAEKKKRVYKPKAKKEKEVVEEQKMKIEEEVIQPQPQPEPQEEIEQSDQPQQQNNDFLHVEEVQPEAQPEEVEEQAGEEMVTIYRVNVEGKKARFIDKRRFMGLLNELIVDETPFEVEFEEISKSHHIYHSLQLQEKAKVEVKQKEKKERGEKSAPKAKRELNNGLQVRHAWKGDVWEAVIQEQKIVYEDKEFKTFSEFAVKHKLYMGQDTSANGVAECEWFNIHTQKWVKGMYQ